MAVTRVSGTSVGGTATTTNLDSSSAGLGDDIFRLVTIVRPSTSTITSPAGWTTVLDTTTNTQSARIHIAYHWCTAAEVTANTSFTWTYSAAETYTFRSSHHSGVDPNDPISVEPIVANLSAATSWTAVPGLTTLINGELVYWLMAHGTAANVGSQTLTLGSGSENWFVEGATVRGGTGSATGYASITAWEQRPTAGAVLARTVSASTSGAWRGYVLSLKPVPAIITGTAAVSLGAASTVAIGKRVVKATAAVSLGAASVIVAGTVVHEVVTGAAAVSLGAVAVVAVGTGSTPGPDTIIGTAAITLGAVAIAAVGRRTTFGTAALSLPAPTITAAGHERQQGTATVTLGGVTVSGTGTVTPPPPGQLYDLSRWHITLPTGSGEAEQIDQPELATYTDEHFYTGPAREMVFVAPVDGETTSGSDATRAELREHEDGSYANSAWDPATTGRRQLTTTSRVDGTSITGGTLPRQEVIFFQIHGATGTPPIYLTAEWTSSGTPLGTPRVRMFVSGTGMSNANLVTGITPETDIAVRCRVEDGELSLWCVLGTEEDLPSVDSTPTFHVPDVGDFNDTSSWYYKHGAYNKTTVASGSSGQAVVQTSFFELLQPGDPEPPVVRSGTAAVALPGPTIAATGIRAVLATSASVSLEGPDVSAVGRRTTPGTTQVALGGLVVTAIGQVVAEVVTGSSSAQLGALSVTAIGHRRTQGTAAIGLGPLSLIASGEGVAETITGTAAVSLGSLSVTAVGTVIAERVTGSAQVAIAGLTITVEGRRAVTATAAVTLPQLDVSGVGGSPTIVGTATLVLGPLVVAVLVAGGAPWAPGEPTPVPGPIAAPPTPVPGLRADVPTRL